ncbi:pheromone A receptor-domain-containing protein [Armillaria novae-zelandiae]|uniref:Pheromone A receptor-domain-containing protein n=1 Tax=Armillaria novae-zelandiae TaxID=153914 RepID=A0AA39KHQ8_9AGAR|nr:pheromone A receptor-domain-containing protein [Armillaria novae-zelandiae]
MSDPIYPLFTVFSFFGFILPIIPLPWHLLAYNSGTCYFIMWSSLASLNLFVNSIVWKGNVSDWAPWWCEISIRVLIGASVGIPASSLCINRRLYHIANVQAVTITIGDKRRAILIDTLICVAFPIMFIALQYVVQGHRYNIFEDVGCYPALYNTPLLYALNFMWPIILGLTSTVYCILSIRAFMRRRLEFNQFLSSNKSLTLSRYFRLMALATTEIMCTTPLATLTICLNILSSPMSPYRSWSDTHLDYSRVVRYPRLFWHSDHLVAVSMDMTRWVTVASALIFFAYFGFASEARRHYRLMYERALKMRGINIPTKQDRMITPTKMQYPKPISTTTTGSLPPYSPDLNTPRSLEKKALRDSAGSIFQGTRTEETLPTRGSVTVELSYLSDYDEKRSHDSPSVSSTFTCPPSTPPSSKSFEYDPESQSSKP